MPFLHIVNLLDQLSEQFTVTDKETPEMSYRPLDAMPVCCGIDGKIKCYAAKDGKHVLREYKLPEDKSRALESIYYSCFDSDYHFILESKNKISVIHNSEFKTNLPWIYVYTMEELDQIKDQIVFLAASRSGCSVEGILETPEELDPEGNYYISKGNIFAISHKLPIKGPVN